LLHHFGTLKEIERASMPISAGSWLSAGKRTQDFEFFHAQPG